ncbi:MAG: hypothetical protein WC595_05500 [Candidatus Nanoarchaeia archaeon]
MNRIIPTLIIFLAIILSLITFVIVEESITLCTERGMYYGVDCLPSRESIIMKFGTGLGVFVLISYSAAILINQINKNRH